MGKVIISVVLILSIIATPVMADIDNVLDNIVTGTYVQTPGVYKSPSNTTLSLGSMSFRLKNDVLGKPIFSLRPPRANMSCAGMDFDAGMLSMLNLDQFEQMLGQAGASLAWGIMIGLVYSLPGIGEAFQKLQDWARKAQMLFQTTCTTGKAIGKSLGEALWGKESTEAGEQGVSQGLTSTISEAFKKVTKYMKVAELTQTFPWGQLANAGFDSDVQNLIASWFGYIDIYVKDGSGNKVTDMSKVVNDLCPDGNCDSDRIGFNLGVPLLKSIDEVLNGGNLQMYYCNGLQGNFCTSVGTVEVTTKGLKSKLADTIRSMRDTLGTETISGSGVGAAELSFWNTTTGSTSQTAAVSTLMANVVPGFMDIVSYSAALKKSSKNQNIALSDSVVEDSAELAAYLLLSKVVNLAYSLLGESVFNDSYGIAQKIPKEFFVTYRSQINEAHDKLARLISYKVSLLKMIEEQARKYSSLMQYAKSSVQDKMGGGASFFGMRK